MLAGLVSLDEVDPKLMYLWSVLLNFKDIKLATLIAQHESVATNFRVNH